VHGRRPPGVVRQDLYEKAGLEGERIVYLLTDTQITHEAFLEVGMPPGSAQERCERYEAVERVCMRSERPVIRCSRAAVTQCLSQDINNLLNSGEVPGMFGPEDKERLAASMRERVEAGGQVASKVRRLLGFVHGPCEVMKAWLGVLRLPPDTMNSLLSYDYTAHAACALHTSGGLAGAQEACYAAFLASARANLHCVLAMSPVGDAFRQRCRRFPALTACTTTDWFTPWPAAALLAVSQQFLAPVDLGAPPGVKAALAQMCVDIHVSVSAAAERFCAELRRRCERGRRRAAGWLTMPCHRMLESALGPAQALHHAPVLPGPDRALQGPAEGASLRHR